LIEISDGFAACDGERSSCAGRLGQILHLLDYLLCFATKGTDAAATAATPAGTRLWSQNAIFLLSDFSVTFKAALETSGLGNEAASIFN